ncbi:MAG: hypothetical protein L3J96_04640, partial [Thermoplasmata archaeon]|nr:hypothetical protein [Thermoplasmata archaeon]
RPGAPGTPPADFRAWKVCTRELIHVPGCFNVAAEPLTHAGVHRNAGFHPAGRFEPLIRRYKWDTL